jgi:hypothetical protein
LPAVIADSIEANSMTHTGNGRANQATVFQPRPPARQGAAWTETTPPAFSGRTDGSEPSANLIVGKGGVLYSTTAGVGSSGKRPIFKIVR